VSCPFFRFLKHGISRFGCVGVQFPYLHLCRTAFWISL